MRLKLGRSKNNSRRYARLKSCILGLGALAAITSLQFGWFCEQNGLLVASPAQKRSHSIDSSEVSANPQQKSKETHPGCQGHPEELPKSNSSEEDPSCCESMVFSEWIASSNYTPAVRVPSATLEMNFDLIQHVDRMVLSRWTWLRSLQRHHRPPQALSPFFTAILNV